MATTERRKSSQIQLLLLDDVNGLGRKGDLVSVRPGYARNYLVPLQRGVQRAVVADAHTLGMRTRLQEERAKQAAIDLEISQALAGQINGITLATHVKVDPEGHMYGSVTAVDIVKLLEAQGFRVERSHVRLPQPIKQVGLHVVDLRLKEGVLCTFKLKVIPEGQEDLPPPELEVVLGEEPAAEV
jgi:large subunit ribosomal protein L9